MTQTANSSYMSSSQEISVLRIAHRLKSLITSKKLHLPLRLLTYDCRRDLSPVGMALVGYEVYAVNSDPIATKQLEPYIKMFDGSLKCKTRALLNLSHEMHQAFDVVLVDGVVFTELRTDTELQEICEKLSTLIRPNGLLIVTPADFDELWRVKKRVLQPRITDDDTGRHLHVIVRDWHGNGYEYTETHYHIDDHISLPTVTHNQHEHRAWRCAEISLGLARAGVEDVEWLNDQSDQHIMIARKVR